MMHFESFMNTLKLLGVAENRLVDSDRKIITLIFLHLQYTSITAVVPIQVYFT